MSDATEAGRAPQKSSGAWLLAELLKDDDSGDHDQNEENSTQKDGEKEKMERDKSQSSSKRKAVVPGPAEHPLQYNYTFWYSRRTPGRPTSSQSYEQNIKQIGTFASVEQFWRFYSHMVRPGDLTGHSDFHLFKEGIKPMWEDDANKNGGKWIIRLRKGLASRCWENLILAMLGEQFMVGEEICGAVVSVRFQEDIISIWNKTASDQATTARIRDTLRRVLNLPPNTIMEYKTHTDSINYPGPGDTVVSGSRLVSLPCTHGNRQSTSLATKVLNVQALSPWPPRKCLVVFNPYTEFPEFSRRLIKDLESKFKQYDAGRDGFIDLMELKLMMEKLGAPQTHLGLKSMIKEVDEDFDGKLSFREFLLIFHKAAAGELQEESGLMALAKLSEIDVALEGVKGAKNFFEAKVQALASASKFEAELKAEQDERKREEEKRRIRQAAFRELKATFST
ncbi:Eukaryotic translation initiation factor 4E type 2 [Myotis brandtii]|uniref:Eukaryotic translation initiation factor 4E type 2 n=2 Tax=Myotis brandtii TaxID=109478 RepID=S7Q434_MYOBR|nr:Eukaryotic translation initiation factor 4E type 2 [Myotis brandtii]